jgi:hypothetical protein
LSHAATSSAIRGTNAARMSSLIETGQVQKARRRLELQQN